MQRMKRVRYRGRRPRGGLMAEQVIVAAAAAVLVVLFLTMRVNSQWCGKTCGQQVYEALFVTEDWS